MHNLFNHCYPVYIQKRLAGSAGSTDHYTECVDTRGYEGVAFLIGTRTCGTAAFSAYAQISATSSDTGTFVDVYGSTVTHTTGFNAQQALTIIDVFRPNKRWARVYIDRATTHEELDGVTALLYRSAFAPTGFSTGYGISDVNIVVGTSS